MTTRVLQLALLGLMAQRALVFSPGGSAVVANPLRVGPAPVQNNLPAPPVDHSRVYILDTRNTLVALPTETGRTPLGINSPAKSDKISFVELKGAHSAAETVTETPLLYLFVPDQAGVHVPFLVRLTARSGDRRVTAIAQKGLPGFAIASEEIVKPNYRVIGREGGLTFMEVRPREPLLPGEYAVIGADLGRIATFRVGPRDVR